MVEMYILVALATLVAKGLSRTGGDLFYQGIVIERAKGGGGQMTPRYSNMNEKNVGGIQVNKQCSTFEEGITQRKIGAPQN